MFTVFEWWEERFGSTLLVFRLAGIAYITDFGSVRWGEETKGRRLIHSRTVRCSRILCCEPKEEATIFHQIRQSSGRYKWVTTMERKQVSTAASVPEKSVTQARRKNMKRTSRFVLSVTVLTAGALLPAEGRGEMFMGK